MVGVKVKQTEGVAVPTGKAVFPEKDTRDPFSLDPAPELQLETPIAKGIPIKKPDINIDVSGIIPLVGIEKAKQIADSMRAERILQYNRRLIDQANKLAKAQGLSNTEALAAVGGTIDPSIVKRAEEIRVKAEEKANLVKIEKLVATGGKTKSEKELVKRIKEQQAALKLINEKIPEAINWKGSKYKESNIIHDIGERDLNTVNVASIKIAPILTRFGNKASGILKAIGINQSEISKVKKKVGAIEWAEKSEFKRYKNNKKDFEKWLAKEGSPELKEAYKEGGIEGYEATRIKIEARQELDKKEFNEQLNTLPKYLQDAYSSGKNENDKIDRYNEAVVKYNAVMALARAANPPKGETYMMSEKELNRAKSSAFKEEYYQMLQPAGMSDKNYALLKPYISPYGFEIEKAIAAKVPMKVISQFTGTPIDTILAVNAPLLPRIEQMTGQTFADAESKFLSDTPNQKRMWAQAAGVIIPMSSEDRAFLSKISAKGEKAFIQWSYIEKLHNIDVTINSAWDNLSIEQKQRVLLKYSPPPSKIGQITTELFYNYPGTLIRPLEPILDPQSEAYKTWQSVKDKPLNNPERKAFVSYWQREGIKSSAIMTTLTAPYVWSGVGAIAGGIVRKALPAVAFGAIGAPAGSGAAAMATLEAIPFIGKIPQAVISLAQLASTGGAISYTGATLYESIRSYDIQKKWETFQSLSKTQKDNWAKLAGFESFEGLNDTQQAATLLRYTVPAGLTQAQWSKWWQENLTERMVDWGEKGSAWLSETANTPLAPVVSLAGGAVLGVLEGLSYIPQIPMIAGQFADTIPEGDPLEFGTQVITGMAEFFTTVLPAAIKANPSLGLGRTAGLFVLSPGAILKLSKSGLAFANFTKYIPERALGREYGTILVEFTAKQLKVIKKMTPSQLLKFKQEIAESLATTGKAYTKTFGNLKITYETTPYQQIVGGKGGVRRFFSATPDITQFKGRQAIFGTLYASPQLAMEAMMRSYLSGVKMKHPGVVEILVPEGVELKPQQLLPSSKPGGVVVELETELRHYIIDPVVGAKGKSISANTHIGSYPIRRFTLSEIKGEPAGLQFIRRTSGGMKEGTGLTVIGDLHATTKYLFEDINSGYREPIFKGNPNNAKTWEWNGTKEIIVQLGDIIDRGIEYFDIRDAWNRLADEAKATGGRVERLLGNHELAYLRGERIKGVTYLDRVKIKAQLLADILSGKVKAAIAINGELFTHAGLSLSKFPEFKGKSAEYIANNLNARLKKAATSNNFYKDKIFDVGRTEANSSFPRKGRANEGGIFWHRYQETTQAKLDLGFKQYTGHSYDPALLKVRMRQPNYVQVDIKRYGGGRGVYHNTPLIEPKFFTEVSKIKTDVAKIKGRQLIELRDAAATEATNDAILGWHWRMEAIKRQIASNKLRQQQVDEIKSQIAQLRNSKDPEAILEIAELKDQMTKMTSPGFYEWLAAESDIGLLSELIRSRRYTAKIKELGGKTPLPPKLKALYLESLNKIANTARSKVAQLRGVAQTEAMKEVTPKKLAEALALIKELETELGSAKYSEEVSRATNKLESALRNDILKNETRSILTSSYLRNEYPTRYISYLEKAARIIAGRGTTRLNDRDIVTYLAYVSMPEYYNKLQYETTGRAAPRYTPTNYKREPILSRVGLEYPISPSDRIEYAIPRTKEVLLREPSMTPRELETLPREPSVPPREPEYPSREPEYPPREPEVLPEEPPTTIISMKGKGEEKKKEMSEKRPYPFTWHQSRKAGWITFYPPYTQENIRRTIQPPAGAMRVNKKNAGTAKQTIQGIGGDVAIKIAIDNGINDIIIDSPTNEPGRSNTIRFVADPEQKTRNPFTLKGLRFSDIITKRRQPKRSKGNKRSSKKRSNRTTLPMITGVKK